MTFAVIYVHMGMKWPRSLHVLLKGDNFKEFNDMAYMHHLSILLPCCERSVWNPVILIVFFNRVVYSGLVKLLVARTRQQLYIVESLQMKKEGERREM